MIYTETIPLLAEKQEQKLFTVSFKIKKKKKGCADITLTLSCVFSEGLPLLTSTSPPPG